MIQPSQIKSLGSPLDVSFDVRETIESATNDNDDVKKNHTAHTPQMKHITTYLPNNEVDVSKE